MLKLECSYQEKDRDICMNYLKNKIQGISKLDENYLDNDGLKDIIGDEGMQYLNMDD